MGISAMRLLHAANMYRTPQLVCWLSFVLAGAAGLRSSVHLEADMKQSIATATAAAVGTRNVALFLYPALQHSCVSCGFHCYHCSYHACLSLMAQQPAKLLLEFAPVFP
ncbi:unnamed protein product [Polarella glacialis]|uniref:Uncharacterized protein n=1 Tax=Polarella glacialis TaxID=89957 RepID=A0A813F4Y7_POLGL|nr:unnamed protein product [Polarella glacialis]CAE8632134.1 unnamed protein product [Polarella glacialis]